MACLQIPLEWALPPTLTDLRIYDNQMIGRLPSSAAWNNSALSVTVTPGNNLCGSVSHA